jgi:hypothetical protein
MALEVPLEKMNETKEIKPTDLNKCILFKIFSSI